MARTGLARQLHGRPFHDVLISKLNDRYNLRPQRSKSSSRTAAIVAKGYLARITGAHIDTSPQQQPLHVTDLDACLFMQRF
jgi:hypothetical protein